MKKKLCISLQETTFSLHLIIYNIMYFHNYFSAIKIHFLCIQKYIIYLSGTQHWSLFTETFLKVALTWLTFSLTKWAATNPPVKIVSTFPLKT